MNFVNNNYLRAYEIKKNYTVKQISIFFNKETNSRWKKIYALALGYKYF